MSGHGLRNQKSRSSLRKEAEKDDTEKEHEKEKALAEAWGILGKSTLRLDVKQVSLSRLSRIRISAR